MKTAPWSWAWVGIVVAWASVAHAGNIGTMAYWAANPVQTELDTESTWLADSGNWDSSELITLSKNVPLNSTSLGILNLTSYPRPLSLSVSYEVSITSSDKFVTAGLSMNFTGANVQAYKDIFASHADLVASPTPGTGTWTLYCANGMAPPDVSLPLLQSMWVRDTIVTDASGSLFGVSNTFVQFIHAPEPGSGVLLAIAAGTAALWRSRSRRRPAC